MKVGKLETNLVDYINHAVRYPERAIANGIEGKVVVLFVVLETGNVLLRQELTTE